MTTASRQTLRAQDLSTPGLAAKRLNQVTDKLNQRIDAASRREIVEFDYGPTSSPVFPIKLDSPGFPVRGVVVMRVYKIDDPTAPLGAGSIDWVPTESGVSIFALGGVASGNSYRIALEMIG